MSGLDNWSGVGTRQRRGKGLLLTYLLTYLLTSMTSFHDENANGVNLNKYEIDDLLRFRIYYSKRASVICKID